MWMRYNTTNLEICTDINGRKSFHYEERISNRLTDILVHLPTLQGTHPHQSVQPVTSSPLSTSASSLITVINLKMALTTMTTTTTTTTTQPKAAPKHSPHHVSTTTTTTTTSVPIIIQTVENNKPSSAAIWWYTTITQVLVGILLTTMGVHFGNKLWHYIERRINTHRFPHMPYINPRQDCPQCQSTSSLAPLNDNQVTSSTNEAEALVPPAPRPERDDDVDSIRTIGEPVLVDVHQEAAAALGPQARGHPSSPLPIPPPTPQGAIPKRWSDKLRKKDNHQ